VREFTSARFEQLVARRIGIVPIQMTHNLTMGEVR
jgi:hypothetical protein